MKTREVAQMLGVSAMTVRNLADSGKLRCTRIGQHRTFSVADVKDFYFDKIRSSLHSIVMRRQRLHRIDREVKQFTQKGECVHDALLADYQRLASQEIVESLVKIAGTAEGCFRKMVELSDLSDDGKAVCLLKVEELGKALKEVREYRNAARHEIMSDPTLKVSVIEEAIDKVCSFFEDVDRNWMHREVAGAEDAIIFHFLCKKSARQFEEFNKAIHLQGNCQATIASDWKQGTITVAGKEIFKWEC